MKQLLLLILLVTPFLSNGQTRKITGKVVDENLEQLPGVKLLVFDTIQLATTDVNGDFTIELPNGTEKVLFSWIGMEETLLEIPSDCDRLEVIMMYYANYHYKSHQKIDRLRKRRFDHLPKIHAEAVAKGLFVNNSPCFTREFMPYKPRLDEIRKQLIVEQKRIKAFYKEIKVGDTIRIPYSGSYRDDGTDRTTLIVWSYASDKNESDCVIEGIILDKNKRHRGYNVVYKVANTNFCNYDTSLVYNKRRMAVGEVFEHNMKYFKVLRDNATGLQKRLVSE